MAQLIQAKDISLQELRSQFHLTPSEDPHFFPEWQGDWPALTAQELQSLKRLQKHYFNLASYRSFSEEAVKMVVLSPLLDLAGFYQAPFSIQTEESVEITAEDQGTIVRGNIDVLVVQEQFWVLVIESKNTRFDVLTALPQALACMLYSPNRDRPVYGLLVNGREFVFVKLVHRPVPKYERSFALSIERENELEQVLGVLKKIKVLNETHQPFVDGSEPQ